MRSKWESHVLPRLKEIEAWARDGVSEEDIAHNLGVAYSTFRSYRDKYSALSEALARTKEYVDKVVVVGAYLRRITGYDATEVRREYAWMIEDGEKKRVLVKEIEQTRHIPGDPRAAEFWLTRRQGKDWPMKLAESNTDAAEEGGIIEIPAVMADE